MFEKELLSEYIVKNLEKLGEVGCLSVSVSECMRVWFGEEEVESRKDEVLVSVEDEESVSKEKKLGRVSILLPFCEVVDGVCEGIKKNHNLHLIV